MRLTRQVLEAVRATLSGTSFHLLLLLAPTPQDRRSSTAC
jgi:hypothetical protein